ncbi:molybdopterin molybdotransferase MoeA [Thalassotalea mangrovi]|uniref:Molybdopterin molybdenumtransferase n=1 Tax=Thalassotalea mangrovi TaxID=2572245 RepID=A0A4U1B9G3_9GAMM|nr:gephyrin-like molybdotransferase Glp [Thalassotalea mangrovi]TKB47397.1 molybdopterin molybdotransferase MoeA [Thalassotalea mangrovi]
MTADVCASPQLLSFEQALERIDSLVSEVLQTEKVAIGQAMGRVCGKPVCSPVYVPPADNSAMDGYAFVHPGEVNPDELAFELVGESFAGHPFAGNVAPGQCVRIMTGGLVPQGCDTVLMQEDCDFDNGRVRLKRLPKPGNSIRRRGEDIDFGSEVISKGQVISAVGIGLLSSLGISTVEVSRQVKVAILASGDELKSPGEPLNSGEIYESNRISIASMLTRLGCEVLDLGIIADDPDALKAAFAKANRECDVVISSGGVSVGEADYTKHVLAEIGEIDFYKIAMKPGKPFACGKLSDSVFFGLPGNPVSALVTFMQLAVPGIEAMQGKAKQSRPGFWATAACDLRKTIGRRDFQRGVYQFNESGMPGVTSTGAQGSGILTSLAKANCFIVLAAEQGSVKAGDSVWVEPFPAWLD